MESVALLGLGAMGSRFALRLLEAGHQVVVWNRSPNRTTPLVERGAIAAATPREAAASSRFLITMLADPQALRSVSEGPNGIAAGAHPALIVAEMSTVGPAAVRMLASMLEPTARVVDAPVLGSILEAESGGLTIFAGGPSDAVDTVEPVLACLGSVVRVGPLGTGAAAKLVANAALLGTLTVLGEALALADGLDLSPAATAAVLAATPLAEQAKRRLALIEAGDYPRRFALSLARKDADLIIEAAGAAALRTPALEATRSWLRTAETDGRGESDYTSMLATILSPHGHARPSYDGLIVDLDGVVWLDGDPIDGVAETLARLRKKGVRVVFLTNDPQHSRAAQARRLREIGIHAAAADVLTVSVVIAAHLAGQAQLAAARTLVIGSQPLRDELANVGLQLVSTSDAESAEIVVVGGHDDFNYAELHAAVRAIGAGATLFATGRDPFIPTRNGRAPATGAIVAAIETATGATATVVGKPEPHMFALALEALADCTRVAVVGDNLATDIAGAKQAGLEAILVLSGATSPEEARRSSTRADVILPSLAALA